MVILFLVISYPNTSLMHVGNFKTYLCDKCVVSLDQVLLNLERQVQELQGDIIPEDITKISQEGYRCQRYKGHNQKHMRNYKRNISLDENINRKIGVSREKLKRRFSEKSYEESPIQGVYEGTEFPPPAENGICAIKNDFSFDRFGLRTQIANKLYFPEESIVARQKISRRSVSLTSNDSYDDNNQELILRPNPANISAYDFEYFSQSVDADSDITDDILEEETRLKARTSSLTSSGY